MYKCMCDVCMYMCGYDCAHMCMTSTRGMYVVGAYMIYVCICVLCAIV